MKVKFKRLSPLAKAPTKATIGAAGADLKSSTDMRILPHGRALIKTGCVAEIPTHYLGFVMGRSGNTIRRGLLVALGLIDSDYRGEIGIMAFNTTDEPIDINVGDRIGQLIIMPIPDIEFEEVQELSPSDRGANGYGSTGR